MFIHLCYLFGRVYFNKQSIGPPEEYTSMPQWQMMMTTIRTKGDQMMAREFDEEGDAEFSALGLSRT
jgi:hypothetical protein